MAYASLQPEAKHKDIVKIKWVALLLCIWNLQLNEHTAQPVENQEETKGYLENIEQRIEKKRDSNIPGDLEKLAMVTATSCFPVSSFLF